MQFLQEKISNKSAKELFDYCQKAEQDYRHFLSGRIQRFLALNEGENQREMINTTHLPLKQKWIGPIDKSGKFRSAYMS